MTRIRNGQKHRVCQYDLEGNLLKIWLSCTDAAKYFKTSQGNISNAARGERNQAQGFQWKYLDEIIDPNEYFIKHPILPIKCSNFGRIWFSNHFKSKGQALRDGYFRIRLTTKDGKRQNYSVHRLICEAFFPTEKEICDSICNNRAQVNHKDKNPSNNHIDNLEWVIPSQNILHRNKIILP